MISDEELEQLRFKGESTDLDFKQAQYPFSAASDHQKSELLKDILAMANAYRIGPGYILIGFRDQKPLPAEVVGIASADHIDDAALQQFVHSKVEPPLQFGYEERMFDGKHVALITIPIQPRPFAPNKDYGKLKKNTVYVRRGSSTDEASMTEISKMAVADAGTSKTARVELGLSTATNDPLPTRQELAFIHFGKLPDYEEDSWLDMGSGLGIRMPSARIVNRHFYREFANYYATTRRAVVIRLSLANLSDFALGEAKLEMSCSAPEGQHLRMLRLGDLPTRPESGDYLHSARAVAGGSALLRDRVSIDDRPNTAICHVLLGTLRPGETGRAETDIAILPTGPGDYTLSVRILAKEIPRPIIETHKITLEGEVKQVDHKGLMRILSGKE